MKRSDYEAAGLGLYTSPSKPSDWSRKTGGGLIWSSELSSHDWPCVEIYMKDKMHEG